MFSRVNYEEYQAIFAIVAFILTAVGFLAFAWQVYRMQKSEVTRQAHLPLEQDTTENLHHG